MDDDTTNPGFVKNILGWIARRPSEPLSQSSSLGKRSRETWLRANAFECAQHDDFEDCDPEVLANALRAIEDCLEDDSDQEMGYTSGGRHQQYPRIQALRRRVDEQLIRNPKANPGVAFRISKRRRKMQNLLERVERVDVDIKKRRVLLREEHSNVEDHSGAVEADNPNAHFTTMMRRHLVSLDHALRKHWVCECQQCSGLSVRLLLPQRKIQDNLATDMSFEVFFGIRDLRATVTALQEAKITVKDMNADRMRTTRSLSEPSMSYQTDFVHICHSIAESLGQRNCLHFALEDGTLSRLRPQPKTFGSDRQSGSVSLSALFKRQQELRGGLSALPLKGKRVLAVTLASALLPFLETPWLQPSFNHSKIQFFEPMQDGQLPDITKPFLALEHIPNLSARGVVNSASSDDQKHMVHPNASVLALGILLTELQYCTPIQLLQEDIDGPRNVNTDYYTALSKLKPLESEAGVDYYLATKACLTGEYFPPSGHQDSFESDSVQRLFYQKVVKRLEAEVFKSWNIDPENLSSFNAQDNESCWGDVGREVIRSETAKLATSVVSRGNAHRSLSNALPRPDMSLSADVAVQVSAASSSVEPPRILEDPAKSSGRSLQFFDANHQSGAGEEDLLSRQWMDEYQSLMYHFFGSFDLAEARSRGFEPVRIAILDSGFDSSNPLLISAQSDTPRIKDWRCFVHGSEMHDVRDEIGHGTHALGLLINAAPCAEIYVAKVAQKPTLDSTTHDDIAKAINYAISEWRVDVITMSFGIRTQDRSLVEALGNAQKNRTLLFAAASNDGANKRRAFPAAYPSVFCIHSTDGNGNPSKFNPTASPTDVNYGMLGENVSSYWPNGMNGHNSDVKVMSGTSVATPIAAGLAAMILHFAKQQDIECAGGDTPLFSHLKDVHLMDEVFKSMVRERRQGGYDYITPQELFDRESTIEFVYEKIKAIQRRMYK